MKAAPKKSTPPHKAAKKVVTHQVKNHKEQLWFLLIIAVSCVIVYFPTLKYAIDVWDDPYYITNNPSVHSFANFGQLFMRFYVGNYQPLTILSYMFEWALVGASPFLYHFDNMLLHLLNSLLSYVLIVKLTKNRFLAFVTGLLFVVHPLHIESVAWASQRKDLLYSLFYFASYIFYLDYREKKKNSLLIISLAAFILSCLSKGMAVVLPAVLVLTDFCFDKKFSYKSLFNKIPYMLISLFFGLFAVFVQKESGAMGFTSKDIFSLSDKFFFINYSFFFYIMKLLWPFHLSGLYPYPIQSGQLSLMYYLSVPFNLLVLGALVYSLKFSKKVLFGLGFYTINVVMILQILSVGSAIAADRYFYMASVGLFYLLGVGMEKFNAIKTPLDGKLLKFFVLGCLTVFFTLVSVARIPVWKNAGTFWTDVTLKYPEIDVAWYNAGAYFYSVNNQEQALKYFDKAISINANHLDALKWRSMLYSQKNDFQKSLEDNLKIIAIDSNNSRAYAAAGEIYGKNLNDIDKSYWYLSKALEKDSANEAALCNMGVVFHIRGDGEGAFSYFMKAYEINPDNPFTLSNLASYYTLHGDTIKAREFSQRAEQLAKRKVE
ncbi:MAG TPA: tetratricopeptide repeat protein [Bacteroidales bacterium]|nr:tetratricopeptide repeat protein [Bacteroidales bacterium]